MSHNPISALLISHRGDFRGISAIEVYPAATLSVYEVQKCLCALQKEGLPDVLELASSVANKATEKYDLFLADELLSADYAASKLDAEGAFNTIKIITTGD